MNTAFIIYRRESITSLKGRKYDACFGSLYAINALLPADYRVKISDNEYNKKTTLDTMAYCKYCEKPVSYTGLKFHDILLPLTVGIITEKEYEKVWDCSQCGRQNKLGETLIRNQVLEEPYFLKIIPKPPERSHGLMDRRTYHKQVSRWVWTFIDELEAQMANYRRDYQPRNEDSIDSDLGMGETGEGEDL